MKGEFKKTFTGFECWDEASKKIHRRYTFGEVAVLENKQPRNYKFHQKFFAVLNLTFQNQDLSDDMDVFREIVIIHAGYYNLIKLIDGSHIKRAKSISFASMDDLEFESLYNAVFNVCLHILGCRSEELEKELLKFD